jgi:hypothetical protein
MSLNGYLEHIILTAHVGNNPVLYIKRYIDDVIGVSDLSKMIQLNCNNLLQSFTLPIRSHLLFHVLFLVINNSIDSSSFNISIFYKQTDYHVYLLCTLSRPRFCCNSICYIRLANLEGKSFFLWQH